MTDGGLRKTTHMRARQMHTFSQNIVALATKEALNNKHVITRICILYKFALCKNKTVREQNMKFITLG